MKRTDAPGATVGNLYTEGNPGLGVPATVVGDEEMNNIQEELAQFIEAAGLVLNGSDFTQLQQAVTIFIEGGPSAAPFTIANNISSATDVTGLLFNKLSYVAVRIFFRIHRETDNPTQLDEVGELFAWYRPVQDDWAISYDSKYKDADAGVVFSITAAGQIQYKSSNLAGGSYVGQLKTIDIKKIPA